MHGVTAHKQRREMLNGDDLAHIAITSRQNANQFTSRIQHGAAAIAGQRPCIGMNAGLWEGFCVRMIGKGTRLIRTWLVASLIETNDGEVW